MRLGDLASLVRSKNAGPYMLTIDVFFSDPASFELAIASKVMEPERISSLYSVPLSEIDTFALPETLSVKISFPRDVPSGAVGDNDGYGCQYMARLAAERIEVS